MEILILIKHFDIENYLVSNFILRIKYLEKNHLSDQNNFLLLIFR